MRRKSQWKTTVGQDRPNRVTSVGLLHGQWGAGTNPSRKEHEGAVCIGGASAGAAVSLEAMGHVPGSHGVETPTGGGASSEGCGFCASAGALVPLPGVFPGQKTDRHGKGV